MSKRTLMEFVVIGTVTLDGKNHVTQVDVDAYHEMHARQVAVMMVRESLDDDSLRFKIAGVAGLDENGVIDDEFCLAASANATIFIAEAYDKKAKTDLPRALMIEGSGDNVIPLLPSPNKGGKKQDRHSVTDSSKKYTIFNCPIEDEMLKTIADLGEVVEYDIRNYRKGDTT